MFLWIFILVPDLLSFLLCSISLIDVISLLKMYLFFAHKHTHTKRFRRTSEKKQLRFVFVILVRIPLLGKLWSGENYKKQACVKNLNSISKCWCRSLELTVSVWRSSSDNEYQTVENLMKHEGTPHFPLAFLFGHHHFHPFGTSLRVQTTFKATSMMHCSYAVRVYFLFYFFVGKIPCLRHCVNDQIFAVYWWKLKPQNDLCRWIMLHHPGEEVEKAICVKLVWLKCWWNIWLPYWSAVQQ